MSTETAAPPTGNINLAQLAASLSQPKSGSPSPEKTVTPPSTAKPPGEQATPEESGAETKAPVLSETPPEEGTPAGESTEDSAPEGQPEAGAESTAEGEPEGEPEAEPEAQPGHEELPPELKEAIEIAKAQGSKGLADVLKRVHKLTSERKLAEKAAADAKAELERVKAEKAEPAPAPPPSGEHPEVARMNAEIEGCDSYLEWCEANPDGGEMPDGKGGKREFDANAVRELKKKATDYRTELVAQRSQARQVIQADFTAKQQHFHKEAVKEYPWLTKPDSPERQEFDEMLKHAPQLRAFPDYELVLGDYVRGRKARMAASKAPAKPVKPRPEPPKVVTDPPSAPPAAKPKVQKEVEEAEDTFKKTGRTSDLAAQFAAQRRARRS